MRRSLFLALAVPIVAAGAPGPSEIVYRGTATAEVSYYDFCDNPFASSADPVLRGTRTVRSPVRVIRNPPAHEGTMGETNPFNLSISTLEEGNANDEGRVSIESARVVLTPYTYRRLLLQHWDLTWDGVRLTGRLTNARNPELPGAGNLFLGNTFLVPCRPEMGVISMVFGFEEGATLEGRLTEAEVDLLFRGRTRDHMRSVTMRIQAGRAD